MEFYSEHIELPTDQEMVPVIVNQRETSVQIVIPVHPQGEEIWMYLSVYQASVNNCQVYFNRARRY